MPTLREHFNLHLKQVKEFCMRYEGPEDSIKRSLVKQSVQYSIKLTYVFSVFYLIFGLSSYSLISAFKPNLILTDNLWPRFIVTTIPFIILSIVMKYWIARSNSYNKMLFFWSFSLALITNASSCIYVWPLALDGFPIIPYFDAANNLILIVVAVVLAPPLMTSTVVVLILIAVYFVPLFVICHINGSEIILKLVFGNCFFFAAIAIFFSAERYRERRLIFSNTASFLGEDLSQGVHNIDSSHMSRRIVYAVVLSCDIRGYSKFFRKDMTEDELTSVSRSFKIFRTSINSIVKKYEGKKEKALGDGTIATFGAYDVEREHDIGYDIEINHDIIRTNVYKSRIRQAMCCVEEISRTYADLKKDLYLGETTLGFGISFGMIETDIHGEGDTGRERDITGFPVILANRLEQHTKVLTSEYGAGDYIVISDEAFHFIEDKRSFQHTTATVRGLKGEIKIHFKKLSALAQK